MTLALFRTGCLLGMLVLATSPAWAEDAKPTDANPETATVVGTVSKLDPAKHAFTLHEDGSDESAEYRAYFRDGKSGPRLEMIAKLVVGEHISITYTEHEGRRVITLSEVPAAPAK